MPMRGELPTATAQTYDREAVTETFWSSALTIVLGRDLQAVTGVALIGLLLTINVVLRYPDFGQAFAELAVFP
jgi:hypothetical protein